MFKQQQETIASAVKNSILRTSNDCGSRQLEDMQDQINQSAEAIGCIAQYLLAGEFDEAKRIALLNNLLGFRYTTGDAAGLLAQAGINTFKNE